VSGAADRAVSGEEEKGLGNRSKKECDRILAMLDRSFAEMGMQGLGGKARR